MPFFFFFATNTNNNTISNYTYQNSPAHAQKTISQTGPIIEVNNLRLLSTNGTLKIFGFHIRNNANYNISNINFTFFTGISQINSTISINLTSQESIFVYLAYNYSNSTDYKLTARASNLTLWSQQSLAIGQNTSRNASNLTQSFIYDANGNMVQDSQSYYEYNSFNQMSRIREGNSSGAIISEYLYDSDGNRIRKSDKIKNETILYINQNFLRVINTTGTFDTIYYYADSQLIARKDPDGKKYFYHPDHLGSTTLVTNESGAVVEDTNYKPFGEPLYDAKSRYLYTGKERDSESGLMYYGARYYSPVIGKFIQPDTELQEYEYAPQSMNRYSYVTNNPYKYVDPTGKWASPTDFMDYLSLAQDINDIKNDPAGYFSHLENWVCFGADIISTAAPLIGGGGVVAKAALHTDDLNDAKKALEAGGDFKKAERANEAKNIGKVAVKELLPEVKAIDQAHQAHILADKHDWGKVVSDPKDWGDVSGVIDKTLKEGTISSYQSGKGVYQSTLKINREVVTVTWKKEGSGRTISNAWVNKK